VQTGQTALRRLREPRALAGLLFLIVMVAFLPALRNDFINYDDPAFVGKAIQAGLSWAGVKWAWTSVVAANWHPITNLSLLADFQIFGMRPWGFHLTNVLLHAANATLFFALLWQITGALWRSLWAAAFFGLHPLRVESVAWVAERKDVLSAFFFLLTLLAYGRWAVSGRKGFYGLALVCFALGLMSKAMLVTLPCVLLLLDYWPLGRVAPGKLAGLVVEKIPFIVLTAVFCVITLRAQGSRGAIAPADQHPLGTRAANAVVSVERYLGKTAWPEHLALPYPYVQRWPWAVVAAGVAGLALATAVAVVYGVKYPYAPVGWLWFLGTLAPVIGLVQVGGQAMADRYTYIPSFGLAIVLAWGVAVLAGQWRHGAALAGAAAGIALLGCALVTQRQLGFWENGETLFRHTLAVTRDNAVAMGLVADALSARGDNTNAMALYQRALAIDPAVENLHNDYGLLLLRQGRIDDAVEQFNEAAKLSPQSARAYLNRGLELQARGLTNEANAEFQKAHAFNENDSIVENNLGVMCIHAGLTNRAEEHFRRALLLNPSDGSAWANIGQLELGRRQTNAAIDAFETALRLDGTLEFARAQLQRLRP